MSSSRGQYLPPQRSRELCRLRSRAGIWPELPLPSWTSVLRIGCLCPGLGLSCVTSVRGDERSWLALGASVTINRICSHSARLGENRTRSDGGGPLQAAQEKIRPRWLEIPDTYQDAYCPCAGMAECLKFARPVVRRGASLYANQA